MLIIMWLRFQWDSLHKWILKLPYQKRLVAIMMSLACEHVKSDFTTVKRCLTWCCRALIKVFSVSWMFLFQSHFPQIPVVQSEWQWRAACFYHYMWFNERMTSETWFLFPLEVIQHTHYNTCHETLINYHQFMCFTERFGQTVSSEVFYLCAAHDS